MEKKSEKKAEEKKPEDKLGKYKYLLLIFKKNKIIKTLGYDVLSTAEVAADEFFKKSDGSNYNRILIEKARGKGIVFDKRIVKK